MSRANRLLYTSAAIALGLALYAGASFSTGEDGAVSHERSEALKIVAEAVSNAESPVD